MGTRTSTGVGTRVSSGVPRDMRPQLTDLNVRDVRAGTVMREVEAEELLADLPVVAAPGLVVVEVLELGVEFVGNELGVAVLGACAPSGMGRVSEGRKGAGVSVSD